MAQIPLSETASADRPEYDKLRDDKTRQIAPDVAYRQIAIVNVIFFGRPGAGDGKTGRSSTRECQGRPLTLGQRLKPGSVALAGQVPSY
jgi:hypothetical protein